MQFVVLHIGLLVATVALVWSEAAFTQHVTVVQLVAFVITLGARRAM